MTFNFHMPVHVISGKNAVLENGNLLAEFGNRCLILTGRNSADICGARRDAEQSLGANGIDYGFYSEIHQNPLLSSAYTAGKICAERNIDFILAAGGGSVLDCAKAAAIFASNRNLKNPEDIYMKFDNPPIPLAVIGTTAGTGSEVSPTAVITVDRTGRKKSITSPLCYPRLAFCDPKYTYGTPRGITVSCALDAFAHAVEGWFSRKRDTVTEMFARTALPMIWHSLCILADGGELSEKMRDELFYGALYAGVELKIGTLFPHALGYILTEDYGVPHGQACAVFDKEFLAWNQRNAPEITEAFLSLLGVSFSEVIRMYDSLIALPEISMSDEKIAEYAERWSDNESKFKNCFGNFKLVNAVNILKKLFGESYGVVC